VGPETPLWFAFIILYDAFELFIPFRGFLWNNVSGFYFSGADWPSRPLACAIYAITLARSAPV